MTNRIDTNKPRDRYFVTRIRDNEGRLIELEGVEAARAYNDAIANHYVLEISGMTANVDCDQKVIMTRDVVSPRVSDDDYHYLVFAREDDAVAEKLRAPVKANARLYAPAFRDAEAIELAITEELKPLDKAINMYAEWARLRRDAA